MKKKINFYELNRKLKSAFLNVWGTHEKSVGGTRWVSLIGLGLAYMECWSVSSNHDVSVLTQGAFRNLQDFCRSGYTPFRVAVDSCGNDWVALQDSQSWVSVPEGFTLRGCAERNEVPSPLELRRKVKEAMQAVLMNNPRLSGRNGVSLVDLGGAYRRCHHVSINEDVKFHTNGVLGRIVDWIEGKNDSGFRLLRSADGQVLVFENDSLPASEVRFSRGYVAQRPSREDVSFAQNRLSGSRSLIADVPYRPKKVGYGDDDFSRVWQRAFIGRRVYVDTEVLLEPSFWQGLKRSALRIPQISMLVLTSVVHELMELKERRSKTSGKAENALKSIEIGRKNGWIRVVESGLSGIGNYADMHFLYLSENISTPVSILTANNQLISGIKMRMKKDFVSLYFFDTKSGFLKPNFRIEVDKLD